jgi:hypothetical protein
MYDAFPHRELIKELGLDSSKLDALLCKYQFKEYDVYSIGDHTVLTMSQIFSIHHRQCYNMHSNRTILGGSNLVNAVFKKHGYNNFVSVDVNDRWLFGNLGYVKVRPVYFNDATKSSVDFVNSLKVVNAIFRGRVYGVLPLSLDGDKDYPAKLAEFANNNGGAKEIFAWSIGNYPGHSSVGGNGFEYEFKHWKPRYDRTIKNMEEDLVLTISKNPGAIIIVMSDHGPSLLDDATREYRALKDDQIEYMHFRDRYGAFMAIHWPDRKKAEKYDKEFNITQDVFPIVFAYLYDSPIPLKYKIEDKDITVRMRDHKFDKGVFYPNFYKEKEIEK